MAKRLTGRRALVTGSSRGIGRQVAIGLAAEGCDVILHGRTIDHTAETAGLIKAAGVRVEAVAADLGDPRQTAALVERLLTDGKPIDILYNNAAIGASGKPIEQHTMDDYQRVFQINVYSLIALCNGLVPPMKRRRWGRVVNVSSGIANQPNLAPYSISKATVDKYTRDLACDVAGTGVLANYMDPGWLKTDLGGPGAMFGVETVLPGALVPVLIGDDGPNGQLFRAQDYRGKALADVP